MAMHSRRDFGKTVLNIAKGITVLGTGGALVVACSRTPDEVQELDGLVLELFRGRPRGSNPRRALHEDEINRMDVYRDGQLIQQMYDADSDQIIGDTRHWTLSPQGYENRLEEYDAGQLTGTYFHGWAKEGDYTAHWYNDTEKDKEMVARGNAKCESATKLYQRFFKL